MNNLRKLCVGAILTLALAISAFADGQVGCPGITSPAPQPTATAAGDIECPGIPLAVSVITSVLSLA